jgi:soluble lytic murein transglycosylase-like protein
MQVMPDTARDPGFGLASADPNNPADMNRLGREYRAKMQEKYGGNLAKMWAAYNMGPNGLDSVIERHGADWFQHVPNETRQYVLRNLRAVGRR